jgi:CheY-like chemotaxis protein
MARVLIVDEDPADAILVREALLECDPGLRVESIRDADEALCSFLSPVSDAASSRDDELELVIVGIRYPGSSGCQFLRRLRPRADARRVPVVVLTEKLCEPEKRRECRAGNLLHLTKPSDYNGYRESLGKVLAGIRKDTTLASNEPPPA